MDRTVRVALELPCHQAQVLAQFIKRVGWSEMRGCATDDVEASEIREAVEAVRRALAEAGFAPR